VQRVHFMQLVKDTESKYALVVAAAKRGRAIMDGEPPLVEGKASKPVTIALEEIAHKKLVIDIPPVSLK
jgi:DNA-directed RNA polymerase subunit omega